METIGIRENAVNELVPVFSRPASDAVEKVPHASERPETEKLAAGKSAGPGPAEFLKKVASGNEEAIRKLAESINEFMKAISYSLQFIPDKEAGMVIIKVLDSEGNVVRRIPPEEMAGLYSRIGSSIGLLVNEKLG